MATGLRIAMVALLLLSLVCSIIAWVGFRKGRGAYGFSYTRYFYGDLRRQRPLLFAGVFAPFVAWLRLMVVGMIARAMH